MFCPNCGTEQFDEDRPRCINCGQAWSPVELEKLLFKYCWTCGAPVSRGAETCDKCGTSLIVDLDALGESDQYLAEAQKLVNANRYLEAIPYLKKALELSVEPTPTDEFVICNQIYMLYMHSFMGLYGEDLERPEVLESKEFADTIFYAGRALSAFYRCNPDFQRQMESDPSAGLQNLKAFNNEFSSS